MRPLCAQACSSELVDVIVLDCGQRPSFALSRANVDTALARGAVFELSYGPALRDAGAARRYLVAHARALVPLCRGGRGVVLTSGGAADAMRARAPRDVTNLARVLGLRAEHARACVGETCRRVVERAKSRRHPHGIEVALATTK